MLKWLATVQVLWINFSVNVNTAGLSIGEKLLLNITQSKAILEMARAMKIRSTEESFSLFIQPMQFTSAMKALAKFPRIKSTVNRMKKTPEHDFCNLLKCQHDVNRGKMLMANMGYRTQFVFCNDLCAERSKAFHGAMTWNVYTRNRFKASWFQGRRKMCKGKTKYTCTTIFELPGRSHFNHDHFSWTLF